MSTEDLKTPVAQSNDHETNLLNAQKMEESRYQELYRPVNRELNASVDSTSLIDGAKARAKQGFEDSLARTKRQQGRMGLQADALTVGEQVHGLQKAKTLNEIGSVNNAYKDQHQINSQVRDEQINTGRGIVSSGMQNLTAAASTQNQVQNQNTSIQAQNDAAATQATGQAAGTAAMMMLMFM